MEFEFYIAYENFLEAEVYLSGKDGYIEFPTKYSYKDSVINFFTLKDFTKIPLRI